MKKHLSFILSAVLLAVIFIILLVVILKNNDGNFVYSFDDAYIHMSISKNLALHGVWGVTSNEFSSSSSSLIWTLLLGAVYYVTGPNEITPVVLNIIPAFLIILSVYIILRKNNIKSRIYIFGVLSLLIILPPLPALIFAGLEHVLHIFISLLFVYAAAFILSGNYNTKTLLQISALAIMLPAIRYEGIVIVAAFCFLLLMQKRWLSSIVIFLLALIPIAVFGIISLSKGWSFFPNSLLLKAGLPDVNNFNDLLNFSMALGGSFIPENAFVVTAIIFLFIAGMLIVYAWKRNPPWLFSRNLNLVVMFVLNVTLYMAYARSGWSYRYQSFIVSMFIFVLSLVLYDYVSAPSFNHKWKRPAISLFVFLFIIIFGYYGIKLTLDAPGASRNIYEQQYQMGKFVGKYYYGSGVALNDIGTCNYFADIDCVDLWGLGNLDISIALRTDRFNETLIRKICNENNVKIAIVYDNWFEEGGISKLPREWLKVGEWKITNNIIASHDIVSFYAVNPAEETELIKNLKLYSESLPASVMQRGRYVN